MNIEDLEEELASLFPDGHRITFNRDGHLVITTNLLKDEDGELICSDEELDEDDAISSLANRSKPSAIWDDPEDEEEDEDETEGLEVVEEDE